VKVTSSRLLAELLKKDFHSMVGAIDFADTINALLEKRREVPPIAPALVRSA
jgi:hypothetical protein